MATIMTSKQAIILALFPGVAEELAYRATNYGNMAWDGIARRVLYTRNVLYFGVALAAIGMVGLAISGVLAFKTTALLGGSITFLAAIALSGATLAAKNQWSGWCHQYENMFEA